jgi:pantothenate kinase
MVRVIGIDSSMKMIKIAQSKIRSLNQSNRLILFPEEFDFVKKYNELITSLILQHNNYHYEYPKFLVSDLYHLSLLKMTDLIISIVVGVF